MGIDISEQMIRYAQKLARHLNLSIRYRQQDVCQMEFADQSFDVVACQLLLHTLPDPLAALREMYRVARPSAKCSECIAQRFCSACWATVGGEGVFNKEKVCQESPKTMLQELVLAYSILEENPQAFDDLPQIFKENPFLWD